MKRTTIYLDSGLELRLKAEGLRRKQPMAELVREAVEVYLTREPDRRPARRRRLCQRAARHRGSRGRGAGRNRIRGAGIGRVRAEALGGAPRAKAAQDAPRVSLLLDTGIVYAYYDRSDDWHARARDPASGRGRGLILPAPVIPEIDHCSARAGRSQPADVLQRHHRRPLPGHRSPAAALRARGRPQPTVRRSVPGFRRCRDRDPGGHA